MVKEKEDKEKAKINVAKANCKKTLVEIVELVKNTNPKSPALLNGKLRIDGGATLTRFQIVRSDKDYQPYYLSMPIKSTPKKDGHTHNIYNGDIMVRDNWGEETSSSTIWKAIDSALLATFYDAALDGKQIANVIQQFKTFRKGKFKQKDNYSPGCNNCFFKESHRPTKENERGLTEDRNTRHFCALHQRYVDKDIQKHFEILKKEEKANEEAYIKKDGKEVKKQKIKNLIENMLNNEGSGCLQHSWKFEGKDGWVVRKPYTAPMIKMAGENEGVFNLPKNVMVDASFFYDWIEERIKERKEKETKKENPDSSGNKGGQPRGKEQNNPPKEGDNIEVPAMAGNSEKKGGQTPSQKETKGDTSYVFTPEMIKARDNVPDDKVETLARALGLGKGLEGENLSRFIEEYKEITAV